MSGARQADQNLWMDFNSRLDELELAMLFGLIRRWLLHAIDDENLDGASR